MSSVKDKNAENCIKAILVMCLVVSVLFLFMHIITSDRCKTDLQASKVDTSRDAILKRLSEQTPLRAGVDYYTVPRNPMPTQINYDIANSAVSSYVKGGIIEPQVI